MCQSMPTGLYMRRDVDSETSRFTPPQDKTCGSENIVMSFFQRTRPECKDESFFRTSGQKKMTDLVLVVFVRIPTLSLKPWVAFTTSIPVKMCVPLSLKSIFNVVAKRESSIN